MRGERGAAAVEFALILPLFALLMMGMLDFGRALNYWIDSTHLANETARWAVVNRNPGPSATLSESMWQQLSTPELRSGGTVSGPTSPARVCVDFMGDASPTVGDPVRVRVTSNFRFMALLGLASVPLQGEAIMRLEANPTNLGAECYPP